MNLKKAPFWLLGLSAGLAVALLVVGILELEAWAGPGETGTVVPQRGGAGDSRDADRAAIRKTTQGLAQAFESGDAAKAAAFLTTGAELIPNEGAPLRGRDTIQKACAQHFAERPQSKIDLEVESLRFSSRDTAIEEGRMRTAEGNGAPKTQRYSLLHVREDGKWLIAVIREWPTDTEELGDLGWLIGSWESKRADGEVHSTYEWFGNKSFIRGLITVREKDRTLSGMQMIGTDPRTGELHVWMFEHDGGFAEGECTRDGESWILETSGMLADGGTWSARNVLVRVNNDTITGQPVYRTLGAEHLADLPPVKVVRSKGTK